MKNCGYYSIITSEFILQLLFRVREIFYMKIYRLIEKATFKYYNLIFYIHL